MKLLLTFALSLLASVAAEEPNLPDDYETATWIGFRGTPLEGLVKELPPVPKSEIDRFNAKHGR